MKIKFRFIIVTMLLTFISGCSWDLSVSGGSSEYVYVVFKENISSNEKDYAKIKVRKGKSFRGQMPEDPRRTGWMFGGWYDVSSSSGGKEYTEDSWVYSDITLYARWSLRGYSCNDTEYDNNIKQNMKGAFNQNVDNYVDNYVGNVPINVDKYVDVCNEYVSVTFHVDNYGVIDELYLNKCALVLYYAPIVHESMIGIDKVFNGWITSPSSSGSIILEHTPVWQLDVSDYNVYAELIEL